MKYVFTFNEINYGRIEIDADHEPDNGEIIEKIFEGMATYDNTDFTDFRLVELDGKIPSEADEGSCSSFDVAITETLKRVVTVDAVSPDAAEQTAADNWRAGDYILDAENFVGVEFTAIPATSSA